MSRVRKAAIPSLLVGAVVGPATVGLAAGQPSVRFVSPPNGATLGRVNTFRVALSSFRISAKDVGKMPKAGEGHLHFSMDGGKYDFPKYSGANGKLAVKLGTQGKYSPATSSSITYTGLPKGRHTLTVQLANNNHTPVKGKSTLAKETFTVR